MPCKCWRSSTWTISLRKNIYSSNFSLIWKCNSFRHQSKSTSACSTHRSFPSKFCSEHSHTYCDFIFSLEKGYLFIFYYFINNWRSWRHWICGIKFQIWIHRPFCNAFISVHKNLFFSDHFTTVDLWEVSIFLSFYIFVLSF